jgi:hypothetical protein
MRCGSVRIRTSLSSTTTYSLQPAADWEITHHSLPSPQTPKRSAIRCPASPWFILSPGYVRVSAYAKSLMELWYSFTCWPSNPTLYGCAHAKLKAL